MSENPIRYVKCPHCGTQVPWVKSQSYRPFCSKRCKLIDLGEWASETYSIAGETVNLDNGEEPSER